MNNRRNEKDRRSHNLNQDQAHRCNRRTRPCRRLNSIAAEWIHKDKILRHPVIWQMFSKLGYAPQQ